MNNPSPVQNIDIFPWDDNFNTGLPKIDEQHRKLVQILNRLASQAVFQSEEEEIHDIFEQLLAYTVYHFETEESVWNQYLSKETIEQEHRETHHRFTEQVTDFIVEQSHKPIQQVAEETLDFLVRWLVSHILETDRHMAYVVLGLQAGLSLEEAKAQASEQMSGFTRKMIDIILSTYEVLTHNTLRLMRELSRHRRLELQLSDAKELAEEASARNVEAKNELSHQRNFLKNLLQTIPDLIWLKDSDGVYLACNSRFEHFVGVSENEIIGKTDFDLLDRDQAQSFRDHDLLALEKEKACANEEVITFADDGHQELLEITKTPLFDGQDQLVGLLAVGHDISGHRKAEVALKQSEQRLSLILNTIPHGIQESDVDGMITYSNAAHHRLLHMELGELAGRNIWDFCADDQAKQELRDYLAHLVKDQPAPKPYYTRNITKDGQTVELEIVWDYQRNAAGEVTGFISCISDITERKKAEIALMESEIRLRHALSAGKMGTWYWDIEKDLVYEDGRLAAAFGSDPAIADGIPLSDYIRQIHPEDRERVSSAFQQSVASEEMLSTEYRIQDREGGERWVMARGQVENNDDDRPIRLPGVISDITRLKQVEMALGRERDLQRKYINTIQTILVVLDTEGRISMINQRGCSLLGYQEDELLDRNWFEAVLPQPEGREQIYPAFRQLVSGQQRDVGYVENEVVCRDGQQRLIAWHNAVLEDDSGNITGTVSSGQDITEQKKIEERLRLSASVIENTAEGVIVCDTDGNILDVNPAFTEILGYSKEEVLGQNPRMWKSGRHDDEFFGNLWRDLQEKGQWRGEIWNRRKDGAVIPEWLNISSVRDSHGVLTHFVAVFSDISQIKQSQEKLDHLAHHDPLTDLPNRLLLNARLEQAILRAERHKTQLALFFLDLDRFKHINDSMGHLIGDKLLQEASRRLVAAVRQDDTVARIGGDEFVLIMEDISQPQDAVVAAQKLLETFHDPIHLGEHEIRIGGSLGICLYPRDGNDAATMLRNADAAMYRAKEEGRNTYQFYTQELTSNAFERVLLENSLRQAIANEELHLLYQPQLELGSKHIVGFEALVRWHHPQLGVVSPVKFIPLAEETGLIHSIGRWVLHTACLQAKEWLEKGVNFGRMAVNLAGPQIQRGSLVEEVQEVLEETGLPPEYLELEVTEGFIMQQAETAVEQFTELRKLGVTIAIDDFGTGYSSLSHLKQLPVHKLKIDQSFVHDVQQNADDVAIVKAVIALGESMGLTVIAEGVETTGQADFLIGNHCHEVQGYLYSRPVSAEEAENFHPQE